MNYQIKAGTLLEDFETIGDWTISGGSAVVDSSIFKTGTGSLKLTSGIGTNCIATKTINLDLSTGGLIYFWIYVENSSDVSSLQIILSNDSGFTNFFTRTFSNVIHEGWNKIALSKVGWSASGSPVWSSNMVRLRVRVNAQASVAPNVYFDSMYYGFYSKPKVIISFDDGWDSQYIVGYPYIRNYNLKATSYIIKSKVDTAGYVTTANLNTLHNAGWDICNHTVNHNNMTSYTQAQAEPEIGGCKDYLISLGFTRRNEHLHLAYPNGGYGGGVLAAMASQGMLTGRTIIDRTQMNEIDSQYLLTRQYHDYTMSESTYKGFIDRVVAEGGSVQINYHQIVANGTGASGTQVEVAQFTDMIDYIAKLHNGGVIDCVTFTEWYDGLTDERNEKILYV